MDFTQPAVARAAGLVRGAARIAAAVQRDLAMAGATKADASPVTVADYAIQAIVGREIAENYPEESLVGEEDASELRAKAGAGMLALVTKYATAETGPADGAAICDWIDRGAAPPGARYWTLDPIDGTKGYLRGGQYAIALAHIEQAEVGLALLGCPGLSPETLAPQTDGAGALLIAARGEGAWVGPLGEGEGAFRRIHVSQCDAPRGARLLRSVEAAHTNTDKIGALAEALGVEAAPVALDSQAKYAVLAAGGAELLFRLLSPNNPDYKEKVWDQAAGALVLEEAGGRITDLRGKPLDFSTGRTLANNTGVFASNGLLHDRGLEALAKVGI